MTELLALQPVGVRVTGLQVAEVDSATVDELQDLLAEHGFAVFPRQQLDDAQFVAFLEKFGALAFSKGEVPLAGFPDLNVVTNVGRKTKPRSVFHVDTSYVREPPAYTALRAVEIPEAGGETVFTNQYRAYETLSPELRETLQGRLIRHVVTGLTLGDDDERAADHPLFRRHPISGRLALYLSTPERCVSISGMSPAAATELIGELYAHSTAPENTYRHTWSAGDVVMWDNRCVMHRADHTEVAGARVLHRGMVGRTHRGERP